MLMKSSTKRHNPKPFPLDQCYAKTYLDATGTMRLGRNVLDHALIVGFVAGEIAKKYSPWLIPEELVIGIRLIAAVHDLGKINPKFQTKLRRAAHIFDMFYKFNKNDTDESGYHYHAGAGRAAFEDYCDNKTISEIIGRHHGRYADPVQTGTAEVLGGEEWQNVRKEYIEYLKSYYQADFPVIEEESLKELIIGIVSVADWIGSSSRFYDPENDWREIVKTVTETEAFDPVPVIKGLSFDEIFGFVPTLLQSEFARSCESQGLYILEAPTGSGKTEAALFAAYKLLETGAARGVYFALPTKVTSEKIHARAAEFLSKITPASYAYGNPFIIHGDSRQLWLAQASDEYGSDVLSWFYSTKKAVLAPFAVGTVDQALLAKLYATYNSVRCFGLAGKVIILDEVHSYDFYTGTIITLFIELMLKLKATVIVLSATLTKARRNEILGITNAESVSECYPLITRSSSDGISELEFSSGEDRNIRLRTISDPEEAYDKALKKAEAGEQVLWIENTVGEAQNVYLKISARTKAGNLKIDTGLLHSAFTKKDRRVLEDSWIDAYGKAGRNVRNSTGRILVGTQVLEQSLDIDADYLITRLAPIDMLVQRIGRLWRHGETKRPDSARPEAVILAPVAGSAYKEKMFGNSEYVYSPYVLYRTYETVSNKSVFHLPSEIREHIESVYEEREETSPELRKLKTALKEKKRNLESMAKQGCSRATLIKDENPSARYSDVEKISMLMITTCAEITDGCVLTLADGSEAKLIKNLRHKDKDWAETVIKLNDNIVSVNKNYIKGFKNDLGTGNGVSLADYLYVGPEDYPFVVVGRIRESGDIKPLSSGMDSAYSLSYDSFLGLRIIK